MKFEFQKYFENSTIHGLCYFSRRYHLVERIFWIISLTCSAICTLILISQFLIKVSNFPIVVYLSDKSIPLSEVDFPAVTFCPDFLPYLAHRWESNKNRRLFSYEKHTLRSMPYKSDEILNKTLEEKEIEKIYTDILEKIENGEIDHRTLGLKILKRLQVVDLITESGTFAKLNFSIPTDDFLDTMNEFSKEFLFTDQVINILWLANNGQYVSEILTPDGLCFTFNGVFVEDLLNMNLTSNDFHYEMANIYYAVLTSTLHPPKSLPRRISTSLSGLEIIFAIGEFWFPKIFRKYGSSLSFYIHNPFELPSMNSKMLNIDVNQNTKVFIDAELNTIDDSLVNYSPKDRNCYLESEKKLKFFKKYTKANCLQECLTDFMINSCGCVEFFMIRNSTTRICSASEKKCYGRAKVDFIEVEQKCSCLRPCNYVKYNIEIKAMNLKRHYYGSEFNILQFAMNFKKDSINHLIYKQQYDTVDLLSYAGGLLGLFAGFSFLSFIELIYWFTVRVIFWKFQRSTRVFPLIESLEAESKFVYIMNATQRFLNNSSIHGLNFIAEKNVFEKGFWSILMIISAIFCFTIISSTREKVPDSQIISYDDKFNYKENIMFPAITLIPEFIKVRNFDEDEITNAYRVRKKFSRILQNETFIKIFIRNSAIMCLHSTNCIDYNLYGKDVYYDSSLDLKRLILTNSRLKWFKKQFSSWNENTKPVFAEIRTQVGMGFTFNMIDADKLLNFKSINSEFKFSKNVTTIQPENLKREIENVSINKQSKAFFRVILKDEELNHTSSFVRRFAILIHNNDALPTFFKINELIEMNSGRVDIEVIPEIIRTERNLRYVNSMLRECYFDGEKSLKFFNKYSQQNCIIECITNYTLAVCNFTDPSLPFENDDDYDQYYHLSTEINCPSQAVMKFYSDTDSIQSCGCKPTCDSTSYHINYFYNHAIESDETEINVWMNTEDAIIFRRYQQFTTSDVISYVGGLLGLLAGISMLSIVEFFYFLVIRVIVDFYRLLKGNSN